MTEPFEISSEEGLPIRGAVHLPANPKCVVVTIHGFKGFKDWGFFPWLAGRLSSFGFAACRFDMSRSGVGEVAGQFDRLDLFADDTFSIECSDLLRVIAHLDREPHLRDLPVFLMGHSRGGGVAILAAREIPRLRGIVTWNAIADVMRWDGRTLAQWRRDGHYDVLNTRTGQLMRMSTAVLDDMERNRARLDVAEAARRLRVPILLLHGGADETVPVSDGRTLAAHVPDGVLVIIGRGTHTFGATHPLQQITTELSLAAELTIRFVAIRCRRRR